MKRNDALAKLISAAHTIMTHPGKLPERVQKAHMALLQFAGGDEFKEEAEEILSNLKTPGGDFSKVTDQDYANVAGGVFHHLTQLLSKPAPKP